MMEIKKFRIEEIKISELKKHQRNYRVHTDEQINHLVKSLEQNGIYKNILVAKDNFILGGHGIIEALDKLGIKEVPIIKLDILSTDSQAIKILVGDNEVSKLAEINDIELTKILKELRDINVEELFGTGFDELMIANLVMVTRPVSEIKDFNEAAEWVGLPDFIKADTDISLIIHFRNINDKKNFFKFINQTFTEKTRYIWWPKRENEDTKNLKFE